MVILSGKLLRVEGACFLEYDLWPALTTEIEGSCLVAEPHVETSDPVFALHWLLMAGRQRYA